MTARMRQSCPERLLKRFGSIQQRIEHRWRYAHAVISFVEATQFSKRGVRLSRQCSKCIEEGELIVSNRFVWRRHGAPDIPRQHFHFVERSHIAHQIPCDKPQSAQIRKADAKSRRIGLSGATQRPGVACDNETVAGYIENVEI